MNKIKTTKGNHLIKISAHMTPLFGCVRIWVNLNLKGHSKYIFQGCSGIQVEWYKSKNNVEEKITEQE